MCRAGGASASDHQRLARDEGCIKRRLCEHLKARPQATRCAAIGACWPSCSAGCRAGGWQHARCTHAINACAKPSWRTRGPDFQHNVLAKRVAGRANGGARSHILLVLFVEGQAPTGQWAKQVKQAGSCRTHARGFTRIVLHINRVGVSQQSTAWRLSICCSQHDDRPEPLITSIPARHPHREAGQLAGAALHHNRFEARLAQCRHSSGGECHTPLIFIRLAWHACNGDWSATGRARSLAWVG